PAALENVVNGRRSIERIFKSGKTIYGINTGFGKLADTKVSPQEIDHLQLNLIRSHAVGTGSALAQDEARAVMAVRLNSLLRGNSGVRPEVVLKLKEFLNERIYPIIPRYGSLGASGDLAPSAHLALCFVGEGFVFDKKGRKVETTKYLQRAGIKPLKLKAKEGLAIINGTQVMTGLACLIIHDAESVLSNLDIAGAMSLEALGGSIVPFDSRVQKLRPLHGQMHVAARIQKLVRDSALTESGNRVQDPYSLRCMPQVHGAFYDSLQYSKSTIESELNSVTDNPIIFPETDEVLNSGNFHGQPIALAIDLLCIALAEASVFSERRIDKLLSGYSRRLPMFLSKKAGLNSGLMVTQYTAAALVAESKILAKPASLESASVSAGQEDHASMGVTAALKTRTVLEHAIVVIAIEMLCAAQALDLLGKVKIGQGTAAAHKEIRKISNQVRDDRALAEELQN
ncbi:MAG: histidine ammonia-lyase, partial [Nitrososphaerales archaeon]